MIQVFNTFGTNGSAAGIDMETGKILYKPSLNEKLRPRNEKEQIFLRIDLENLISKIYKEKAREIEQEDKQFKTPKEADNYLKKKITEYYVELCEHKGQKNLAEIYREKLEKIINQEPGQFS